MEKQNAGYANTDKQFEKVVRIVEDAGENYTPTKAHLSIASLNAFKLTIEPMITRYDSTERLYKAVLKQRSKLFEGLDNRVRRAATITATSDIAPHVIEKVTHYKNLIDGTNIAQKAAEFKAKVKKAEKSVAKGDNVSMPTKGRSVSEQSISLRLLNYKSMLAELSDSGNYDTNEKDMTLTELQRYYNDLNAADLAVAAAKKVLDDKLAERNALIGGETNSVKSIVQDIKAYFLGKKERKLGKEYKAIVAIKFFNVKSKGTRNK